MSNLLTVDLCFLTLRSVQLYADDDTVSETSAETSFQKIKNMLWR